MKFRRINKAILIGIVSGVFLGLLLKWIEYTTGLKVYTLLLNVDYIPIINTVKFPEWIEFGFHLIISVILSIILMLFLHSKQWPPQQKLSFVLLVSIAIGLLLYPTTTFSTRTPALTSLPAFSYWLLGHALYGWVLGLLLKNS